MKKNELITLVIGIVVIGTLGWFGGIFTSAINSHTLQTMNAKSAAVPKVEGKNISTDPKIQIIEVVTGTSTEAKKNSHVYVNYTGMLEDGTVFDSSLNRGVPIDFVLSAGKVIKGWDIGLLGMKVGGKRRLIISSEYAYGAGGVPGTIPANSTLIFDVELVNVK